MTGERDWTGGPAWLVDGKIVDEVERWRAFARTAEQSIRDTRERAYEAWHAGDYAGAAVAFRQTADLCRIAAEFRMQASRLPGAVPADAAYFRLHLADAETYNNNAADMESA